MLSKLTWRKKINCYWEIHVPKKVMFQKNPWFSASDNKFSLILFGVKCEPKRFVVESSRNGPTQELHLPLPHALHLHGVEVWKVVILVPQGVFLQAEGGQASRSIPTRENAIRTIWGWRQARIMVLKWIKERQKVHKRNSSTRTSIIWLMLLCIKRLPLLPISEAERASSQRDCRDFTQAPLFPCGGWRLRNFFTQGAQVVWMWMWY